MKRIIFDCDGATLEYEIHPDNENPKYLTHVFNEGLKWLYLGDKIAYVIDRAIQGPEIN